jgi:The GLUG motif
MKKFNNSAIVLFALLTMVFLSVNVYALPGSGTQGDPWRIESLSDFDDFTNDSDLWDDYTRLDVDLDLTAATYLDAPIAPDTDTTTTGFQGAKFTGSFNGNSYTIANLTINMGSLKGSYLALFGFVDSGAEIKDLTVADCSITGRSDSDFIGALAGINNGTIERCSASGSLSGRDKIGGLIGYNSSTQILNCYAQVTVTGDDDLGGLIGGCYGSNVFYCYATGASSGDLNVGGLIGNSSGNLVTACFWDSDTGGPDNGIGTGKTTSEMKTQTTFTNAGWDFVDEFVNGTEYIWMIDEGNDYPRYWLRTISGSGTESEPFIIGSRDDFDEFISHKIYWLSGLYTRLEVDIDLTGTTYTTAPIAPDANDVESYFQGLEFGGAFDGNNHIISNLTIDTAGAGNDYLGLFGRTGSGTLIKDLGIENCDITGGDYSSRLGGLAGFKEYGSIVNCYTTGSVTGEYDSGSIGGLVGHNYYGTITDSYSSCEVISGDDSSGLGGLCGYNVSCNIINCYATGNVTGGADSMNLGGLCGNINSGDIISNCYATGNVSGDIILGGLVGLSIECDISNSYATGSVIGSNIRVGGLCGTNKLGGSITNCYSAGYVSGLADVGGLVGYDDGDDTSVNNCFWDVDTSNQTTSAGGGTGEDTTDMQTQTTFTNAGWDFLGDAGSGPDYVWTIDEGVDYPRHISLAGSGSESNPFIIRSRADFDEFSSNELYWAENHYARMETDIDLTGTTYTAAVIAPDTDAAVGFQGTLFAGSFNGNGHVISNLTIVASGESVSHVGLFGRTTGTSSILKNISIEDCNVTGVGYVGALVGLNHSTVTNCYITGTITGTNDYIGGLTGYNGEEIISHCRATVTVSGDDKVGGLVGSNAWGYVNSCSTAGSINGNWEVGGLVGGNSSSINNCCSTASVTGNLSFGGLVGNNYNAVNVDNCYAAGAVAENGGGLIGLNDGDDVNDCFWDIDTSGRASSDGGQGKTTRQMKTVSTFLDAGWDLIAVWNIEEDQIYPLLRKYLAFDANYDSKVDLIDLAAFAEYWLDGV